MKNLTQESLKEIVHYDKNTGVFTWINHQLKHKIGKEIKTKEKYIRVVILNKRFSLHHLAILYVEGWLPKYKDGIFVDHKDRDTHNNSYNNLNVTDGTGNNKNTRLVKNNTSGLSGIYKINSGFRVRVQQNYKRVQIYSGPDFFEACCKRLSFNNKNNFNKNHGRLTSNDKENIKLEEMKMEKEWLEKDGHIDNLFYTYC